MKNRASTVTTPPRQTSRHDELKRALEIGAEASTAASAIDCQWFDQNGPAQTQSACSTSVKWPMSIFRKTSSSPSFRSSRKRSSGSTTRWRGWKRVITGAVSSAEDEISEARLLALPFAVRCVGCEEAREPATGRRQMLERRFPAIHRHRDPIQVSPGRKSFHLKGYCADIPADTGPRSVPTAFIPLGRSSWCPWARSPRSVNPGSTARSSMMSPGCSSPRARLWTWRARSKEPPDWSSTCQGPGSCAQRADDAVRGRRQHAPDPESRQPREAAATVILGAMLLVAVRLLAEGFKRFGDNRATLLATELEQDFIVRTFKHVIHLPLSFFSKRASGMVARQID